MLQDINSMYKIQLYFYTFAINSLKTKLRKEFQLKSIKIFRNRFAKEKLEL